MAVLGLQEQQLHHDHVGAHVVNRAVEKDDAVLEQQVADRHLPLPHVFADGLVHRGGVGVFGSKTFSHGRSSRRSGPFAAPCHGGRGGLLSGMLAGDRPALFLNSRGQAKAANRSCRPLLQIKANLQRIGSLDTSARRTTSGAWRTATECRRAAARDYPIAAAAVERRSTCQYAGRGPGDLQRQPPKPSFVAFGGRFFGDRFRRHRRCGRPNKAPARCARRAIAPSAHLYTSPVRG